MKVSRDYKGRGCAVLCCNSCRLSVSSLSEEAESSTSSERYPTISRLAHAMVQERLDQMIRETQEARHAERRRQRQETKFIVMVAMEKSSYDPREDFQRSMVEMIMANRIEEPNELRNLLNYYVSLNSKENREIILEVFHEVCSNLFSHCKCRW